jgi:hypothetical protein
MSRQHRLNLSVHSMNQPDVVRFWLTSETTQDESAGRASILINIWDCTQYESAGRGSILVNIWECKQY